jgi:hypothetical protein
VLTEIGVLLAAILVGDLVQHLLCKWGLWWDTYILIAVNAAYCIFWLLKRYLQH